MKDTVPALAGNAMKSEMARICMVYNALLDHGGFPLVGRLAVISVKPAVCQVTVKLELHTVAPGVGGAGTELRKHRSIGVDTVSQSTTTCSMLSATRFCQVSGIACLGTCANSSNPASAEAGMSFSPFANHCFDVAPRQPPLTSHIYNDAPWAKQLAHVHDTNAGVPAAYMPAGMLVAG
jgi:hypothetical protein